MSDDLLTNYTVEDPVERQFVVFENGEYPFTHIEINAVVRNPGKNPYIPLKLEFTRESDGATTQVYENIVFAANMKWKIDQYIKCVGADALPVGRRIDWTDINFIKWLLNRKGRATLIQQPVQGKDYMRNAVDRWIYKKSDAAPPPASSPPPARSAPPSPSAAPAVDDDDDIPPF
jgi:hypothetical protein